MIRQAVTRNNVDIIQDPGVPQQLADFAMSAWRDLMQQQGNRRTFIDDMAKAKELENLLLAGTGLTAEQFTPITQMWEMTRSIQTITDYKEANEEFKKYYHENEDKFSVEAKASYGPFSVKTGYTKTIKDIKEGFFKDEKEFKQFRDEHKTEKGLAPRITPRGLDLIEKLAFDSNIQRVVSVVAYYPTDQLKRILVPASLVNVNTKLPHGLVETIPLGTIFTFACTPTDAPEGWMLCNGAPLSVPDVEGKYSAIYRAIGTKYNRPGDAANKKFRLPDLRGRVVVGAGQGEGLTKRDLGTKYGEETVTLTKSQMPAHAHGVYPHAGHVIGKAGTARGAGNNDPLETSRVVAGTTTTSGAGNPHSNTPPSLVVHYMIKY